MQIISHYNAGQMPEIENSRGKRAEITEEQIAQVREAIEKNYPDEDNDTRFLSDLLLELVENSDRYAAVLAEDSDDLNEDEREIMIGSFANSFGAFQILPEIVGRDDEDMAGWLRATYEGHGADKLTNDITKIKDREYDEREYLIKKLTGVAWASLRLLAEDRHFWDAIRAKGIVPNPDRFSSEQ